MYRVVWIVVSVVVGTLFGHYICLPLLPYIVLLCVAIALCFACLALHDRRLFYCFLIIGFALSAIRTSNENRNEDNSSAFQNFSAPLHQWAVKKFDTFLDNEQSSRVVAAMTIGQKSTISKSERTAYSKSGIAHLLAVSGMHVGIVWIFLATALMPLLALRNGDLWLAVVGMVLLWCYACLCGGSPSAVRATIMFSVLQICFTQGYKQYSVALLSIAVVGMILFSPHIIFDVGFELSVVAVFSILALGVPLYNLCRAYLGIVAEPLGQILIAFSAVIAVSPLTIYYFGIQTFAAVLLSPLLMPFAQILVCFGLLALLLPVPLCSACFVISKFCAEIILFFSSANI